MFLVASCFMASISAQTKFEKGFYLDNNGQKTEGLIKNIDWLNDPKKIDFKANEN